ncbi:MAG: hypothetical protein U5R14_06795 [Gemmatimonadota bacterium]|nr:hypothetical protein [Gemmatimonadota bacterium]
MLRGVGGQSDPGPPGRRLEGLLEGALPLEEPRDGVERASGLRDDGLDPADGVERAPELRDEGRDPADGSRRGSARDGADRRDTLGRSPRSERTAPEGAEPREGRDGTARRDSGADRVDGLDRVLGVERGSERTLARGRPSRGVARAAGARPFPRGATVGRRSPPDEEDGAARSDGRRPWLGATRADGRLGARGVARVEGRSSDRGATRADGRSRVDGVARAAGRASDARLAEPRSVASGRTTLPEGRARARFDGVDRAAGPASARAPDPDADRTRALSKRDGAAIRPDGRPVAVDRSWAIRVPLGAAEAAPARRTAVRDPALDAGDSLYRVNEPASGEGR